MSKHSKKSVVRNVLLGAALGGLAAGGCGTTTTEGDDAPRALRDIHDPTLTVAKFKDICEERGGLTQVHASCGGTNSCRGLIYNSWAGDLIVEHTCAGFNSCAGISCVDMPEDSGKSAQDIYESSCMNCHGGAHDAADASMVYTVFAEPGGDVDAAVAAFEARTDAALVNDVAFGARGTFADGTPYSNMPAFHEELSLGEVRSVVEYLQGLEIVGAEMEILGINAEIETTPEEHH